MWLRKRIETCKDFFYCVMFAYSNFWPFRNNAQLTRNLRKVRSLSLSLFFFNESYPAICVFLSLCKLSYSSAVLCYWRFFFVLNSWVYFYQTEGHFYTLQTPQKCDWRWFSSTYTTITCYSSNQRMHTILSISQ